MEMDPTNSDALGLEWVFGFSQDLSNGVINLAGGAHLATGKSPIFYAAGHTGVIYDPSTRSQTLLRGHKDPISAVCVSADKRWIVTGDSGEENILIIWDSLCGEPVRTIETPHKSGISAIDISVDSTYITTISAAIKVSTGDNQDGTEGGEIENIYTNSNNDSNHDNQDTFEQEIAIWAWTEDEESPIHKEIIPSCGNLQTTVKFNPNSSNELVTNGPSSIIFWSWDDEALAYFTPVLSRRESVLLRNLTSSCFLSGENASGMALTGTKDGRVIVWESPYFGGSNSKTSGNTAANTSNPSMAAIQKCFSKSIQLSHSPISCIQSVMDKYVCVASEDGAIRFYDYHLRIEGWFEELNAGPITSCSFSADTTIPISISFGNDAMSDGNQDNNNGLGLGRFYVPDFIVGTNDAYIVAATASMFEELDAERRRGVLLVQGIPSEPCGVAAHPSSDKITIGCRNGGLQLWDYQSKVLLNLRQLNKKKDKSKSKSAAAAMAIQPNLYPNVLAYDPLGKLLCVGMKEKYVKVLDGNTLEDVSTFNVSDGCIECIKFSPDGQFMSYFDDKGYVYLYYNTANIFVDTKSKSSNIPSSPQNNKKIPIKNWAYSYLGRYKAHHGTITGLDFFRRENGRDTLVSVGTDRFMCEYDLANSSVTNGLLLVGSPHIVEHSAVPTACSWYPRAPGEYEDRIITANNQMKFKQWNSDNVSCRHTCKCPSFGGVITKLTTIPITQSMDSAENSDKKDNSNASVMMGKPPCRSVSNDFIAYATNDKVIGLMKLPLDGNPNKWMGVIAHAGEVNGISFARDGNNLFSCGKEDRSIHVWKVDTSVIEDSLELMTNTPGYDEMDDYIAMLKNHPQGDLYEEFVDYFYYIQLKLTGEKTTAERKVNTTIPLTKLPQLMRAVGFFPSEMEANAMIEEVKYSQFTVTGKLQDEVDLNTCIKLFINHSPENPIQQTDIDTAFSKLSQQDIGVSGAGEGSINISTLKEKLTSLGEKMTTEELEKIMLALTGEKELDEEAMPVVNSYDFSSKVLGFELESEISAND